MLDVCLQALGPRRFKIRIPEQIASQTAVLRQVHVGDLV